MPTYLLLEERIQNRDRDRDIDTYLGNKEIGIEIEIPRYLIDRDIYRYRYSALLRLNTLVYCRLLEYWIYILVYRPIKFSSTRLQNPEMLYNIIERLILLPFLYPSILGYCTSNI